MVIRLGFSFSFDEKRKKRKTMHCVDCGDPIQQGCVGHFVGGFREAPVCRKCSDKERGITRKPKTIPFELVPGMEVAHFSIEVIDALLDYEACGGTWGELLAPASPNSWYIIRRYGGTHTVANASIDEDGEHWYHAYGPARQYPNLEQALAHYATVDRASWHWHPYKIEYTL